MSFPASLLSHCLAARLPCPQPLLCPAATETGFLSPWRVPSKNKTVFMVRQARFECLLPTYLMWGVGVQGRTLAGQTSGPPSSRPAPPPGVLPHPPPLHPLCQACFRSVGPPDSLATSPNQMVSRSRQGPSGGPLQREKFWGSTLHTRCLLPTQSRVSALTQKHTRTQRWKRAPFGDAHPKFCNPIEKETLRIRALIKLSVLRRNTILLGLVQRWAGETAGLSPRSMLRAFQGLLPALEWGWGQHPEWSLRASPTCFCLVGGTEDTPARTHVSW